MSNNKTMRLLSASELERLDLSGKIDTIEKGGVYLHLRRSIGPYKVALFAYNGFYAEVWLHERKDVIKRVEAFCDVNRLDLYLNQVSIDSVYSLI